MNSTSELRTLFLDFFESKGHTVLPSYSLIPSDDPSILLIGAGMAPLKKFFTGQAVPPNKRVATCQKCVRVGDIEEVGKTARHLTFFEMLGNFSFGDYFKKESLTWGLEFLQEVLNIPKEKLWASVYEEDDEAYEIWLKELNFPEERIVRLGKEDNFWEIGLGPSGPCSEIYVDRGPQYGCGDPNHKPGCDCDQYVEIWNHVFTQFDKQEDGSYQLLDTKNIDTGMGLERLAMVMQDVATVYDIDLMQGLLQKISSIAKINYPQDEDKNVPMRIIADHARSMTFLISDGVIPSNEGRGYVLRKLIRRASLQFYQLGVEGRYLRELGAKSIELYESGYPELAQRRETILSMIDLEEEKFQQTLKRGMQYLEEIEKELLDAGEKTLSGDNAFKLYDTYGFPLSLTQEIMEGKGFEVDLLGFDQSMKKQQENSRAQVDLEHLGWQDELQKYLSSLEPTTFVGYDCLSVEAGVQEIIINNELRDVAEAGEKGQIILDKTPFYATGGGQVGDRGYIESEHNLLNVITVEKKDHLYLHHVEILRGELRRGDRVLLKVDPKLRQDTARNHSATHLLHEALLKVLGEGVNQAGSLVDEDRLRFDFNYFEPLTTKQLQEVEDLVNETILSDYTTEIAIHSLEDAKKLGARALFTEKYDQEVRVVTMGSSRELCGGTHVERTAEIGLFVLLSERGIASGVRRIEASTGRKSLALVKEQRRLLEEVSSMFKTTPAELPQRIHHLQDELKELNRENRKLKDQAGNGIIKGMISDALELGDLRLYTKGFKDLGMEELKALSDQLQSHDPQGFILLISTHEGKVSMVCASGDKAQAQGYKAGKILSHLAKELGGGGGGRDHFATAGARHVDKVPGLLENIVEALEKAK